MQPKLVQSLENVAVAQVACGGAHTVVISGINLLHLMLKFVAVGKLYAFGSGEYGQLGLEFGPLQQHSRMIEKTKPKPHRRLVEYIHQGDVQPLNSLPSSFYQPKPHPQDPTTSTSATSPAGGWTFGGIQKKPSSDRKVLYPALVTPLSDKKVAIVACGYWHTIAVVLPDSDTGQFSTFFCISCIIALGSLRFVPVFQPRGPGEIEAEKLDSRSSTHPTSP